MAISPTDVIHILSQLRDMLQTTGNCLDSSIIAANTVIGSIEQQIQSALVEAKSRLADAQQDLSRCEEQAESARARLAEMEANDETTFSAPSVPDCSRYQASMEQAEERLAQVRRTEIDFNQAVGQFRAVEQRLGQSIPHTTRWLEDRESALTVFENVTELHTGKQS